MYHPPNSPEVAATRRTGDSPMKGKRGPRPSSRSKSKVKKLNPKKDFDQPVRRPRQQRLPTMDDAKIEILHSLATDYADMRDRRMQLGKKEVELKGKILDVLKAHKMEHYHYSDIDITVINEKQKVRVKIGGGGDEATDEPEEAAESEPGEDPRE
jgi:hypothetical protein